MQRQHETCTVEGCERKHKARGYCQTHYMQQMRGAPITPAIATRDRNPPPTCTEPGCSDPTASKGLCAMHYARLLRHGHTRRPNRARAPKPCSVPECDLYSYARGECHRHYLRRRRLRDNFGITPEDVQEIYEAQGCACAICRKVDTRRNWRSLQENSMDVDHCHETGKVRGLLCSNCNRGIGLLQDRPQVLASAIVYLSRYAADSAALLRDSISTLQSALPCAGSA